MPADQSFITIVIATYNEKPNIKKLLPILASLPLKPKIIIIDDNSPDGTARTVEKYITEYPEQIELIERPAKLGYGSAFVCGLQRAIALNSPFIISMDADFSHDPREIVRMVSALKYYDVVIGSRYEHGIRFKNWSISRVILSYCSNLYIRLILRYKIKDCTSGYRGYRLEALKNISLERLSSNGYSFLFELIEKLYHQNSIIEIPIVYYGRSNGSSKISFQIFFESLVQPWILLAHRVSRKFSK